MSFLVFYIFFGFLGFLFENAFNVFKDIHTIFRIMTTNEILYQCPAIYRIHKSTIQEMRKRKFLFLKSCNVS